MALDTPIAFCIFNRPMLTLRVFDAIAQQRPKRMFIIADGPREHVAGDEDQVAMTRAVLNRIDWPCEVQCNFSNQNLGCRNRMATGLTWAFDHCERLIVLEDDCLPDQSFFGFCESLLERYENDERIMMISGDNFQPERRTKDSYYFSRYPHIWGWASWRRAWDHYDIEMPSWPVTRGNRLLADHFEDETEYEFWQAVLDRQHSNLVDTWDYAWAYACWKNNGLTILPEVNLICNLGFDSKATHTTDANSAWANLATTPIGKLKHPKWVERLDIADRWTFENLFNKHRSVPTATAKPGWRTRFSNLIGRKKSA